MATQSNTVSSMGTSSPTVFTINSTHRPSKHANKVESLPLAYKTASYVNPLSIRPQRTANQWLHTQFIDEQEKAITLPYSNKDPHSWPTIQPNKTGPSIAQNLLRLFSPPRTSYPSSLFMGHMIHVGDIIVDMIHASGDQPLVYDKKFTILDTLATFSLSEDLCNRLKNASLKKLII